MNNGWRRWLALALLVAAGPAAANDGERPGQAVFEPTRVWKVHLTIPAAEYAAMQPQGGMRFPGSAPAPKPAELAEGARQSHRNSFGMDLPWAKGTVTVGDQTFADAGIRFKGNGTIADAARTIKKSFKIDLDHFGGTATYQGLKTLNLHCGVTDPSKSRETLAYGLYRAAGVPASRTALAEVRLTVPGKFDQELLGVYTVVEQVDKAFLRAQYGTDQGLLMKPEGLRDFEDRGDDWERYKKPFVSKREATRDEAARLISFCRLVQKADDATFAREIGAFLDVDGYLRFLAVTAFVANTDSFFVLGHNYYLYLHPKTGKLHFLPWDLDRAFANFPILGSNNRQMDLSLTHPYAGPHRLTDRLLAVPEVGAKYQALLKELAGTAFARDRLLKEVETMEAAVRDLLARETQTAAARKEGSGGFGPPGMFGKPPDLRKFLDRRTASVAAQLEGKSKGFVPSGGFGPGAFKVGDTLAGPLLEALDTDKDEKLSRAEWVAAARKVFAACKADDQGRVNQKALADGLNSLFPRPPEGGPGAPMPGFGPGNFLAGPLLQRADADKDGMVTLAELVAAAEKLFDQFDKAKAGQLDEEAFADLLTALFPAPQFGPPPGPPPGGPRPGDR